jgi:hypothetical protein
MSDLLDTDTTALLTLKHPQEASRLDAPDFDEPIGTAGGEVVPCKRAGRVEPDGIGRGPRGLLRVFEGHVKAISSIS